MLNPVEKTLFILLVAICSAAAVHSFSEMLAIINRGQGRLSLNQLPARIARGIMALVTQGGIIRHRKLTSLFHYAVAWGFIFYLLVNVVDVAEGLLSGFHFFSDNIIGQLFRLVADVLTVGILLGTIYLALRRFTPNPGRRQLVIRENVTLLPEARAGIASMSAVVLIFILFHVGFRFLSTIFLVARDGRDPWQPFASLVAPAFNGWSETALSNGWHISWWIAIGLILLFLPYFPYTKHAHLFMGPLNFMTRRERPALGALDPIDFDDESIEQFGVSRLTDLHPSQIVDAFACIMCNRCQDACPAYVTGKELSPAALEVNKHYYIKANRTQLANGGEDTLPLINFAMSDSALWACTSCGACVEVCPVGNEPMLDILDMRRDRVLMDSDFPDDLKSAFVGMERQGNPWGTTENRAEWAKPLDFPVPTVAENPDYEYLFWVGCAGAYDPEGQKVARAVATIMNAAGISFAILGEEESCTGDSARRAGNEYLYVELASANIEILNGAGANERRIVTSCPHCFTTLGKEYAQLGGDYTVFHHTQLISDLVGQGKLRLNGNKLEQVTFHDPCYLGRHNKEYDAPRNSLTEAGVTLLEMKRSKQDSFCCGAGGAQMWKEEEHGTQAVNIERFAEAKGTGAQTVAVGCPFCSIMMNDARRQADSTMVVKDVAQVIVESMV